MARTYIPRRFATAADVAAAGQPYPHLNWRRRPKNHAEACEYLRGLRAFWLAAAEGHLAHAESGEPGAGDAVEACRDALAQVERYTPDMV